MRYKHFVLFKWSLFLGLLVNIAHAEHVFVCRLDSYDSESIYSGQEPFQVVLYDKRSRPNHNDSLCDLRW